jgi:hypothetical protein
MRSLIPLVAVVLVSLAGCGASTQSARFIQAAPTPDTQPISYFSTRMPTCPYEELGVIQGYPYTGLTRLKLQKVLDNMTAEARRMGGHAIIGIAQTGGAGAGTEGEPAIGLFGTVVRFASSECTT